MAWRDSALPGTGTVESALCVWDLPCLASCLAWVRGWGGLEVMRNEIVWLLFHFLLGMKLKETGEEGERRCVKESTLTLLRFM